MIAPLTCKDFFVRGDKGGIAQYKYANKVFEQCQSTQKKMINLSEIGHNYSLKVLENDKFVL